MWGQEANTEVQETEKKKIKGFATCTKRNRRSLKIEQLQLFRVSYESDLQVRNINILAYGQTYFFVRGFQLIF